MKELLLIGIVAIAIATFVNADDNKIFISSGCSCHDKEVILNKHNALRKLIATGSVPGQPKASNMQKMVWDDKLEAIAQNWANRMRFEHNVGVSDSRFSHVGENIYTSYYSEPGLDPDWEEGIQNWFDENTDYDYTNVNSFQEAGHYTQVIWANTINVGCGLSYYQDKEMGMYVYLYVCDYGPGGNFYGQHPYEEGEGCEELCSKGETNGNGLGESCA